MKKKQIIVTIVAFAICFTIYPVVKGSDSNSSLQPGSVDDPIITKSYFDLNIKQKVIEEISKLNVSDAKGQNTNTNNNETKVTASSKLTIIKLEPGQSLYGGSGTEFIVRTGKTVVFSNDESGIVDVTIGKDIAAGQAVELNHMLIVPREGRGIKPDPKNNQEIYVMVRGSYLLTNADGSKVSP